MKSLIGFFLVLFLSAQSFAKCFVVRDESDQTKWAVIGVEGFIPQGAIDCPQGAELADGDSISVIDGKAQLDTAKKTIRKNAEEQARQDALAAKQAKAQSKADLKNFDKSKIKDLPGALEIIEKLIKAQDQ